MSTGDSLWRRMIALIAETTLGREADVTIATEELPTLYHMAEAQDMAHLLADPLARRGLLSDKTGALFRRAQAIAVYRTAGLRTALAEVSAALSAAHIPFLPLKGAVLRARYPREWMRTSCDIDVLVRQTDLSAALSTLTGEPGYRQNGTGGTHDVSLHSPGGIHVELHFTLIEPRCRLAADAILQRVWEMAQPGGEGGAYVMPDALLYVYHLAHMAKHLIGGGCGIRPFLDVCFLRDALTTQHEQVEALLSEAGLSSFARAVERLSDVWFRGGEEDDISRQLEAYLCQAGVYGSMENRVTMSQVRRGGKLRYLLSRVFLPYRTLRTYYPALERHPWLLPWFECARWCRLLFRRGQRTWVRELRVSRGVTSGQRREATELLAQLGLADTQTEEATSETGA